MNSAITRAAALWGGFALFLLAAPWIFHSSLALTMLSQMGYLVIICLSYNLLLGQGGMLSFGHAVYTGLGAFVAVHAMNRLLVPLVFVPIVGGLAAGAIAALLGWVSTKKSGTSFAMISLGLGELVAATALMLPQFFGGESGITTNRVYGTPWWGVTFGPAMEVYYLIAAYCFMGTVALFAFTQTPLGQLLNAVRDNPQRIAFLGYDPRQVRYRAFIISGLFAGIGGALAAINFEIVTAADSVSMVRSGTYLVFTFLGGSTVFFGPMLGAVLLVWASVLLSDLTPAWLLYLGLLFLVMVIYAPGGIASIALALWNRCRGRKSTPLPIPISSQGEHRGQGITSAAALVGAGLCTLLGFTAMVEMIYHTQLHGESDVPLNFLGITLNPQDPLHWWGAALLLLGGLGSWGQILHPQRPIQR